MGDRTRNYTEIIASCIIWLFVAIPAHPVNAADLATAARELATKVASGLDSLEKVELTFRNISSLNSREAAESWQALEREFRSRGMRFAEAPEATVKLMLTLSENPRSYILVAELQRDQTHTVLMTSQSKPEAVPTQTRPSRMAIQVELVFEQNEPILDLAEVNGDLLVLGPESLSLYRRLDDAWQPKQQLTMGINGFRSRDARGKLVLSGEDVQVYLPGTQCQGTVGLNLVLKCLRQESPWPLEIGAADYAATMNYFTLKDLPPFFAVAGADDDTARTWVLAGVDGRTHLYSAGMKQLRTFTGWGTDVAGIDTDCGRHRQILVTLPSEHSDRGIVQAFELEQGQAFDTSSPAELPGPITALWPAVGAEGVWAVSRDSRTGRYAAFRLSVSCGR